VVSGAHERVLLVGVTDDVELSSGMVDVIPFSGGTARPWMPGFGVVPAVGTSRFGYSVASSG
jgi:hypothetical protein